MVSDLGGYGIRLCFWFRNQKQSLTLRTPVRNCISPLAKIIETGNLIAPFEA